MKSIASWSIILFASALAAGVPPQAAGGQATGGHGAGGQAAGEEIRSMPLTNVAGSECPTTGVRVEAVTPRQAEGAAAADTIVLSIPAADVAEQPNLRLYKLDSTAFAFEEFKELNSDRYADRRAFSVVVARSENLRFKVGFDSRQN